MTLDDLIAAIERAADVLTRSQGRYTRPYADLVRALATGVLWSPLRLREAVQAAWADGEAVQELLARGLREYQEEHPDPEVEMRIGDLDEIEPPAGWEERVDARVAALIAARTASITTLDEVLALIGRAATDGDESDHEALVRHLGQGVLATTEQLRAAVIAAWPVLSEQILIAARAYQEETRAAALLEAADPGDAWPGPPPPHAHGRSPAQVLADTEQSAAELLAAYEPEPSATSEPARAPAANHLAVARAALLAAGVDYTLRGTLDAYALRDVELAILDPSVRVEDANGRLLSGTATIDRAERRRRARLPAVVALTRLMRVLAGAETGESARGLIPGGECEDSYRAAVAAGIDDPDPVWLP